MKFQYKGLKANLEKVAVREAEVERRLEQLRQQSPAIVQITNRLTQLGDEVVLDYAGTVDGVAFAGGTAQDQCLTLGSGMFIPGFEEQLIGKELGSEVSVHVTFPASYPHRELAGKPAHFACRIKAIQLRREYALDDTFAREVGKCNNMEEMRALMRESLRSYYDERSEQELLDRLLRQAAQNLNYTPKEEEIEQMLEQQMKTIEAQLAQKGLRLEDYCRFMSTTKEQLREDQRPEAVAQLKNQAVIRAIGELERLEATEKDMAAARNEICRSNRITPEQLNEVWDEAFRETVRMNIIGGKVLRLLRETALVTEFFTE